MMWNGLLPRQLRAQIGNAWRLSKVVRFHSHDATPEEISAARSWLSKFTLDTIPKRLCEVSFSRSSGPGGQNVNKVSSKATLRIGLEEFLPMVPPLFHPAIRSSQYYARKSDSILIQADDSRKQSENSHACFVRLHKLVADAGAATLPGDTSVEQKEHVKRLQVVEKERRIHKKKIHSSKKASRRGGGDGDY